MKRSVTKSGTLPRVGPGNGGEFHPPRFQLLQMKLTANLRRPKPLSRLVVSQVSKSRPGKPGALVILGQSDLGARRVVSLFCIDRHIVDESCVIAGACALDGNGMGASCRGEVACG